MQQRIKISESGKFAALKGVEPLWSLLGWSTLDFCRDAPQKLHETFGSEAQPTAVEGVIRDAWWKNA